MKINFTEELPARWQELSELKCDDPRVAGFDFELQQTTGGRVQELSLRVSMGRAAAKELVDELLMRLLDERIDVTNPIELTFDGPLLARVYHDDEDLTDDDRRELGVKPSSDGSAR